MSATLQLGGKGRGKGNAAKKPAQKGKTSKKSGQKGLATVGDPDAVQLETKGKTSKKGGEKGRTAVGGPDAEQPAPKGKTSKKGGEKGRATVGDADAEQPEQKGETSKKGGEKGRATLGGADAEQPAPNAKKGKTIETNTDDGFASGEVRQAKVATKRPAAATSPELAEVVAGAKWLMAKLRVEDGFGGPVMSLRTLVLVFGPKNSPPSAPQNAVRMHIGRAQETGPDRQNVPRPPTPPPSLSVPPRLARRSNKL